MEYVLKMQLDGGREREGRLRMYLVAKKSIQKQYVDLCTRLHEHAYGVVFHYCATAAIDIATLKWNHTKREATKKKYVFPFEQIEDANDVH